MNQTPLADIRVHFANLDDPRMDRTRLHELIDILVIAICAVICGADDWVDVEAFGKAKESWLRTFLELPNGIPAHDTFNRVFARLDPDEFETSFLGWVQAVVGLSQGEVVAVDGKQLRRSHTCPTCEAGAGDQALGKSAIGMVSAWAAGNRLVLGQVKVAEKSNEITAIPKLLEVLELHGCLVTTDAMGTQTEIAAAIVDREADYLLALKKNQGHLYDDVAATFAEAEAAEFQQVPCDPYRTVNKGHGRLETRECWLINRADYLNALGDRARWPHLNGIAMIRA